MSGVINNVVPRTVTILSGQSLSNEVSLGGLRLFGIDMPASWTAANLTFQATTDNGATWKDIYDATGNELTVSAASSRNIVLIPDAMAAVTHLKLRSGTEAVPVAQAADRTITLILRSY